MRRHRDNKCAIDPAGQKSVIANPLCSNILPLTRFHPILCPEKQRSLPRNLLQQMDLTISTKKIFAGTSNDPLPGSGYLYGGANQSTKS
jgi:hypothetical protein